MAVFKMAFDVIAVNKACDALRTQIRETARPAALAGALVLVGEVERNVDAIGVSSGKLSSAIYVAYSKDNSSNTRFVYHVSWNTRKAPHGHLLEYGYVQRYRVFLGRDGKWHTDKHQLLATPRHIAARPFVRPAAKKMPDAIAVAVAELNRRFNPNV